MEMERRAINPNDVKCFWALNTWDAKTKREVRAALETGVWVHLGSTATGHTRAAMTEQDGLDWLREEYGDNLQTVIWDLYGYKISRLR